jgi:uncharacterized membrane protein
MTAKDAQNHIEDIKAQLSHKMFHKASLEQEIKLIGPKFESSIVIPKTTNIRNLRKEDLNVDVVPVNLANMELIQARKAFYYANEELANINVEIETLITLYNTYNAHIAQELKKQAAPCTDIMVFEAYHKAKDLKNLSPEESEALKNIGENLMVDVNAGKEKRILIYETLQNLIAQHS